MTKKPLETLVKDVIRLTEEKSVDDRGADRKYIYYYYGKDFTVKTEPDCEPFGHRRDLYLFFTYRGKKIKIGFHRDEKGTFYMPPWFRKGHLEGHSYKDLDKAKKFRGILGRAVKEIEDRKQPINRKDDAVNKKVEEFDLQDLYYIVNAVRGKFYREEFPGWVGLQRYFGEKFEGLISFVKGSKEADNYISLLHKPSGIIVGKGRGKRIESKYVECDDYHLLGPTGSPHYHEIPCTVSEGLCYYIVRETTENEVNFKLFDVPEESDFKEYNPKHQ